jgi:hypothetical protein
MDQQPRLVEQRRSNSRHVVSTKWYQSMVSTSMASIVISLGTRPWTIVQCCEEEEEDQEENQSEDED